MQVLPFVESLCVKKHISPYCDGSSPFLGSVTPLKCSSCHTLQLPVCSDRSSASGSSGGGGGGSGRRTTGRRGSNQTGAACRADLEDKVTPERLSRLLIPAYSARAAGRTALCWCAEALAQRAPWHCRERLSLPSRLTPAPCYLHRAFVKQQGWFACYGRCSGVCGRTGRPRSAVGSARGRSWPPWKQRCWPSVAARLTILLYVCHVALC